MVTLIDRRRSGFARTALRLAACALLVWMAVDLLGIVPCQAAAGSPASCAGAAGHVDDCFCCACCVTITDSTLLFASTQVTPLRVNEPRHASDQDPVLLFRPPRH